MHIPFYMLGVRNIPIGNLTWKSSLLPNDRFTVVPTGIKWTSDENHRAFISFNSSEYALVDDYNDQQGLSIPSNALTNIQTSTIPYAESYSILMKCNFADYYEISADYEFMDRYAVLNAFTVEDGQGTPIVALRVEFSPAIVRFFITAATNRFGGIAKSEEIILQIGNTFEMNFSVNGGDIELDVSGATAQLSTTLLAPQGSQRIGILRQLESIKPDDWNVNIHELTYTA